MQLTARALTSTQLKITEMASEPLADPPVSFIRVHASLAKHWDGDQSERQQLPFVLRQSKKEGEEKKKKEMCREDHSTGASKSFPVHVYVHLWVTDKEAGSEPVCHSTTSHSSD